MTTLDDALAHLETHCAFSAVPGTAWTNSDFETYATRSDFRIPPDLEALLRRVGTCAAEENDGFVATYEDGTRLVHETQMLSTDCGKVLDRHSAFIANDSGSSRFPLPMVFFGTADAGQNHLLMNGREHSDRAVYLWVRNDDPFGTGGNARGLGRVADTLFDFLAGLHAPDALEAPEQPHWDFSR
ncbi:hypothetical protein NDN16_18780 [Aureimonas altamirensis]|uniref:hypothetical protein n=1 Tax=Aureimonas altamirensis TaxID=370622 RepID=UPI002036F4D9|nr:hypothetical protein [Aureimonas altamirensis]MCM2505710.1 hypothetical protein [Aureimonas altamirensis]